MAQLKHRLGQVLIYCYLLVKECSSWPEGTYGIPMPEAGCPDTTEFEWLIGSRTQQTEPESHASTPIHLAGIKSEHSDKIVQNFCMKTSYPKKGEYQWGRGSYCVFKKGDCPKNFRTGWVYWDDAAPFFGSTIQVETGAVPDGEYDRNTKIEYCCRKDGSITTPITLPTHAPFYLFQIAEGCQKVKNTQVTEEWVYWADEDLVNLSGEGGLHPKLHRSREPYKFTRLSYCYYVPKHAPVKNYRITMTVIYCISGIVSVFLLAFVIMLVIQKCCTRKQTPPYIVENNDNSAQEAMISTATTTTAAAVEANPINILRRNGAANRDNELLDYFPESAHVGVPEEELSPPRYSQLDHRGPSRRPTDDAAIPMVTITDAHESLPPSYEEVLRETTDVPKTIR